MTSKFMLVFTVIPRKIFTVSFLHIALNNKKIRPIFVVYPLKRKEN